MFVPGKSADTTRVSGHRSQPALSSRIPDLHKSSVGANGKMRTALDPAHARHGIVSQLTELGDAAARRVPHIYALAQSDTEYVLAAPVDQVEVEVIGQIRCIQDFVWHFGDCPWGSLGAEQHALAVELDRR